jgi:hypothetical protein
MKKILVLMVVVLFGLISCKKTLYINDAVMQKDKIDKTENPALQEIMKGELTDSLIVLTDLTVKDITASTNIDYDFCVLADIQTEKGKVEVYLYTKNIKVVSTLVKGKTKIDVTGEFGRFFSMLDDYFTKIEIISAKIQIKK